MLELNLLPPKEKNNLAYEMRTRAVLAVSGGLAAVALIFIALLLPTVFLLFFQKAEMLHVLDIERENSLRASVPEHITSLNKTNRLARLVIQREGSDFKVFPVIESFLKSIPSSIRLSSFSFDKEKKELVVNGYAPTRESMIEFKRALESNSLAAKVDSPPSNLIKETDIDFSIKVTVK